MSPTLKVLAGLAVGFALGLIASGSDVAVLRALPTLLDPVGTLWVNGIRMTVIPLVVSALIVAIADAPDPRALGRIGGRAFALFVVIVLTAAIVSAVVGPPLLALIAIDPAAATALRESATASTDVAERAKELPTLAQWITALVPVNPIKAAVDGAMLPLIIFSLVFGAAAGRVPFDRRDALVRFMTGVRDASITLVRWMLVLAPIGVFALAAGLAAKLGVAALGAVAGYVALVCGITAAFALLGLYPLAVIGGRIPLREFARAALPAQAVAFSARSSLAALPAMVESTGRTLRLGDEISGFLVPLAVTMFRAGAAVGQMIGALFIAKLYGIDIGLSALTAMIAVTVVTNFSIPGIPGGSILMIAPVLMAAGVPVAGVGILLGVDTIPDMFRTTTNVTGDMAVAAALGGRQRNAALVQGAAL